MSIDFKDVSGKVRLKQDYIDARAALQREFISMKGSPALLLHLPVAIEVLTVVIKAMEKREREAAQ